MGNENLEKEALSEKSESLIRGARDQNGNTGKGQYIQDFLRKIIF